MDIDKLLIKEDVWSFENLRDVFKVIRSGGGEILNAPSYARFELDNLDKSVPAVMGGVD